MGRSRSHRAKAGPSHKPPKDPRRAQERRDRQSARDRGVLDFPGSTPNPDQEENR